MRHKQLADLTDRDIPRPLRDDVVQRAEDDFAPLRFLVGFEQAQAAQQVLQLLRHLQLDFGRRIHRDRVGNPELLHTAHEVRA